ncbi:MAG: hypothetical protein F4Y01_02045 [Gammaproteobacteria bacterium]|nr:hypothetical protein [Gammaproteobacteria bacterium]
MKNITVSVDEETHRRARIRAAEMDTSVSALVRGYLADLTDGKDDVPSRASVDESEAERRARGIRDAIAAIIADGGGLRMADNLSREELYDRDRARDEARQAAAAENEKRERG